MNLFKELPMDDVKLLKSKGYEIEDKEYSQEDLERILLDIGGDVAFCSSKGNEMNEVRRKYSNIIGKIEKAIKGA